MWSALYFSKTLAKCEYFFKLNLSGLSNPSLILVARMAIQCLTNKLKKSAMEIIMNKKIGNFFITIITNCIKAPLSLLIPQRIDIIMIILDFIFHFSCMSAKIRK